MKDKLIGIKNFFIHPTVMLVTMVIITGVIGGFVSHAISENKKEEKFNELQTSISSNSASFDEAKSLDDKIESYITINNEYNEYISDTKSRYYFEEIKNEYENCLASMKEDIIGEFNSIIEANSIDDFEKTSDEDIKKSIDNLVAFNNSIKTDVSSIDEVSKLKTEIETMISDMRKHFTSNYDDTINKNTIKDAEKVTDKSKLEKSIENLNELKDSLNKEADTTIADEKVLEDYNTAIDDLIESYENRIKEIKKAEEEKKQEEKEEDNNSSSNNSSSNNNSSNNSNSSSNDSSSNNSSLNDSSSNNSSSNNNSSNNSNSSSNDSSSNNSSLNDSSSNNSSSNNNGNSGEWHGGLHHTYTDTETGFTTYFYNDGYCYDDSGAEGYWK